MSGEVLIVAALKAPLIGVAPRKRNLLHAVTMEGVVDGWDRGRVTSACGTEGLKLMAFDKVSVPWPPRVDSLGPKMTRCRECHVATGRKRPRSRFVAQGDLFGNAAEVHCETVDVESEAL